MVGLELAQAAAPDLIVCDIDLPRLDGYQVAQHLKAHPNLHAIPLIAVTAFAMVGDRERVLTAGFDGYIAKPIVPRLFMTHLEAFMPGERVRARVIP